MTKRGLWAIPGRAGPPFRRWFAALPSVVYPRGFGACQAMFAESQIGPSPVAWGLPSTRPGVIACAGDHPRRGGAPRTLGDAIAYWLADHPRTGGAYPGTLRRLHDESGPYPRPCGACTSSNALATVGIGPSPLWRGLLLHAGLHPEGGWAIPAVARAYG